MTHQYPEHQKAVVDLCKKMIPLIVDLGESSNATPDQLNCAVAATYHFLVSNFIQFEILRHPEIKNAIIKHHLDALDRLKTEIVKPPAWIKPGNN